MTITDNNNPFFTMHTLQIESPAIPTYAGQPALVPTHLTGTEGINHLFSYKITLKTSDAMSDVLDMAANFERLQFIGKPLTINIDLNQPTAPEQAAVREINGIITDITLSHREARHYIYTLTVSPWLYLSTLRRNSRIYQDQTAADILKNLLSQKANLNHAFEIKLTGSYPTLDYVTQFNETDFDFFSRLCEEWGINYFFEHEEGKHTLILADNMNTFQVCPHASYQTIPFYENPTDIDIGIEYIDQLALTHQITSGKYSTNDYDYKNAYQGDMYVSKNNPLTAGLEEQEVYSWNEMSSYAQPHGYQSDNIGDILTTVRMESLHAESYKTAGHCNIRGLIPGTLFTLENHPNQEANDQWVVIGSTLTIEENSETSVIHLTDHQDHISCAFHLFPINKVLRPHLKTPKPLSHGPQIAIVTTDGDNNQICTDSLGRIRVKFLWDRNSANTNQDSCWIRVATSWAGMQSGSMYLPRKGQEVIIDYIGGNLDRPICTGQVYNQSHPTPWELPLNQAISGIKSAELNQSGRSNYLLMDDTENSIQTQLCSDHLNSKLSLGNITDLPNQLQPERTSKGEGFYLETDGKGTVRADNGMMITTAYKPELNQHWYWSCTSITAALAKSVLDHTHPMITNPLFSEVNAISKDLVHLLAFEAVSKIPEALANTAIMSNEISGGQLDPSINVSSASNINMTSTSSTHVISGSLLTLSSADHTSVNVGQSLIASIQDFCSIFVKAKDYILNTLHGKIILHAQENNVEISAKDNVILHSSDNNIQLSAHKNLLLSTARSKLCLQSEGNDMVGLAHHDMQMHAGKNIKLTASEKMLLQALKALTIECREDEIIISSSKKVTIKGGISESTWCNSGITHKTTGIWKQYASAHQIETPKAGSKANPDKPNTPDNPPPTIVMPSSKDVGLKYKYLDVNAASNVLYHAEKTIGYLLSGGISISVPLVSKYIKKGLKRIPKKWTDNKLYVKDIPTLVMKDGKRLLTDIKITAKTPFQQLLKRGKND